MFQRFIDYLMWTWKERSGKPIAKLYDELSLGKYDKMIQYDVRSRRVQKALSLIDHKYKSVLDLACGTGAVISALSNKKSLSVLGIDISSGMLDVAKKRFASYPNIKLQQKDFIDLSFSPSSFDLIVIAHALRFIPKEKDKQFLNKINGWLTKEGTFLVIQTNHAVTFFKGNTISEEDEMIRTVSPILPLKKKITIGRQYFIFKIRAYYFKKQ